MNRYARNTLERRNKSNLAGILATDYGQDVDFSEDGTPEASHVDLVEAVLEAQDEAQHQEDAGVRDDTRVRLTLHSDGSKEGAQPQFVAVNGRGYTIPKDVEVDVPRSVADVLNDAKYTFFEATDEQGPDGSVVYNERTAARFAMSVKE